MIRDMASRRLKTQTYFNSPSLVVGVERLHEVTKGAQDLEAPGHLASWSLRFPHKMGARHKFYLLPKLR